MGRQRDAGTAPKKDNKATAMKKSSAEENNEKAEVRASDDPSLSKGDNWRTATSWDK